MRKVTGKAIGQLSIVPACMGEKHCEKEKGKTGCNDGDMQISTSPRELEQVFYLGFFVRRALTAKLFSLRAWQPLCKQKQVVIFIYWRPHSLIQAVFLFMYLSKACRDLS